MVDNAPILSHKHAGLTIEGYSRAAVQTYWRIPELKLGFDLGVQPWEFMGTPTWFLTHTHLDHVAALPVYVARRRMMRMEPPTIYVPAYAVEDLRRLMLVLQRLDRGRMVCNLLGVNAGDEIELSRDRAQIARERIQLERLREEIRTEQERTGRDEELQNRQAACQRLREPEPR